MAGSPFPRCFSSSFRLGRYSASSRSTRSEKQRARSASAERAPFLDRSCSGSLLLIDSFLFPRPAEINRLRSVSHHQSPKWGDVLPGNLSRFFPHNRQTRQVQKGNDRLERPRPSKPLFVGALVCSNLFRFLKRQTTKNTKGHERRVHFPTESPPLHSCPFEHFVILILPPFLGVLAVKPLRRLRL